MSLGPGLVNICLLAEGFPSNISPVEVAKYFCASTSVTVHRIAPWSRTDTTTTSGWLLLLLSHDDQVRCLWNFKTFEIFHRNERYKITLNYPQVTLTSHDLNWAAVEEEEEWQMASIPSDKMQCTGVGTRVESKDSWEEEEDGSVMDSLITFSYGQTGPQAPHRPTAWKGPQSQYPPHAPDPPSAWKGPESQYPSQAPDPPIAWKGAESQYPSQAPDPPIAWKGPESQYPSQAPDPPIAWKGPESQYPSQAPDPPIAWKGPESQYPPHAPDPPSAWKGPESQYPSQAPDPPIAWKGPESQYPPHAPDPPSAWKGPESQYPPHAPDPPSAWKGPESQYPSQAPDPPIAWKGPESQYPSQAPDPPSAWKGPESQYPSQAPDPPSAWKGPESQYPSQAPDPPIAWKGPESQHPPHAPDPPIAWKGPESQYPSQAPDPPSAWKGPESQYPSQAPDPPIAWKGPESQYPQQAPDPPSAWKGPESQYPSQAPDPPSAWKGPESQYPPHAPDPSSPWKGPESQGPPMQVMKRGSLPTPGQHPSNPPGGHHQGYPPFYDPNSPNPDMFNTGRSGSHGELKDIRKSEQMQTGGSDMDSLLTFSSGYSEPQAPHPPPVVWKGPESQHPPQQHPPHAPDPPMAWKGPESQGPPMQVMKRGSLPTPGQHPSNPPAGRHEGYPPFYDPNSPNPDIFNAGRGSAPPGYPPHQQDSGWNMGGGPQQQGLGQSYPVGHGYGSSAMSGTQQSQNYGVSGPAECRPMQRTSPPPPEGFEPLIQGLEDFNLRSDPFPYCPSNDQQPARPPSSSTLDENDFQSDFVVLQQDTSITSSQNDSVQSQQFHLRVTELPPSVTERELQEFFQDRRQSGGGPVSKVELNTDTRSAAIHFADEEVIQRVLQKAPLLLKDKMIQVEKSSACPQQVEPAEIKTVEIRGLQSEDKVEMCIYYFENPAKGGGDIESSDWNEEEKILFITFADPKVAKAVAEKGHKLGSTVLEVSLYSPPVDEPEESQPQCTVEVRGFDPAQTELYEMYFSNPKKGGDTIVELSLNEDNTVMFITFETPEIAQRVAGRPHKAGGRQLEVIVAPVEDPTPPCTVLVRGCDPGKEEICHYYFENPKKGGGDIADFVVDEEQQAIRITFEDPEVAQAVVAGQHKVGGRNLEVSLYTPKKTSAKRQKPQEPRQEEEEAAAPLRTVVVSMGQHPLGSEDTYTLYFESRRHGGGEVDHVEFDAENQRVFVTFEDPAVAERVAGKQHRIVGHPAEVCLYIPPKPKPTYPNKLLFQNVADSTTRECLCMYLERITEMEPVEVMYGDELGTVLVTFPQEPDFSHTVQMSQKRSLEKRYLKVSKVPISNCLLVENLSEKTTEDTVLLYFESKRSSGGAVEGVRMVPEEKKCFIYFDNHEVLEGVLSQSHSLDGQALRVKRYLECLGQSGGSDDPMAFTMPQPLVLDKLDRFKVAFLRQSQSATSGLFKQLSSNHAQGRFEENTLYIDCTLTVKVPKARILARSWRVDAEETVLSFLALLEVITYDVVQQLWTEVEQAVQDANISSPEGATLFHVAEEASFVVVGMKSMAKELYDQVSSVIRTKEGEIEKRKQRVTETIPKLTRPQLSLLLAIGFSREAGKRHEGLTVDIQKNKKMIVFQGLLKDVKEAEVEMYQLLNTVKTQKITTMTDMQKKVLGSKETKNYIVQKFKDSHISSVWEVGQKEEITVFAFDDRSLVEAIHIITRSVVEHVCHLSPESSELLHHPDWQTLVSVLTKDRPQGVLLITPSHDQRQVFVTCIDSLLHAVVEEVEKFLAENTIYSQSVCFSPSRMKLVLMKLQNRLQAIATNLKAYKVQITVREDAINIKGTRKGLQELMKQLELLNETIVCHEEVFEDPNKVKLLKSDFDKELKLIGDSCRCVLSLHPEDSQLQVMGSGTVSSAGGMQRGSEDMQTSASAQLPNGVTVSVVQGDITQMAVGAIVNAANNRMDHIGGLAQDIVKKGGDSIQKECHDRLQQRGQPLKEGDVIVSGPGRLQCKFIIHAVGPLYKGGRSGEQDCLFDTVMTCLQTANDLKLSSIAIPAISTGIFGYPAVESTKVIVEAVEGFFNSHRRCPIKSVYLCHIGANIVELFSKALRKTFPSEQSSSTGHGQPAARKDTNYRRQSPVATDYGRYPEAHHQTPMAAAYSAHPDSTQRIITVSVIPGEIAKQSADVIVNSTSAGLALHNGAVSSSILKAAGQSLQTECSAKYPGGVQVGGMARTTGHALNCREIFHIVICNYSNSAAKQILEHTVKMCLSEASKQRYTSLAFPVLGTGNLGFPADVVATIMLETIHQFEQEVPSTSLQDVRIVVYPSDRKNLQEFQSAQRGAVKSYQGAKSFGYKGASARQNRVFSSGESSRQTGQTWKGESRGGGATTAEFDIGGLRFVIKKGDITEEDTDAIVNSTNSQLDLSRGGVASALRRKCGTQLETECKRKVQEILQEGIVTTKAYGLKSKVILHVNADEFSRNWEEGIELCLTVAEQQGLRSVAMPALGTGIGLSAGASAQALFNTVVRMFKHGAMQPRSLAEVRVVLFESKMIGPFVDAVQQTGEKHNNTRKGIFNWIKSAFKGGRTAEVRQTVNNPVMEIYKVSLFIYAESQSDVYKVLKTFNDTAKEKFTRQEIQDEVICSFKDKDVRRVEQIGLKHKAEVKIQTMTGTIICDGLHTQVFECVNEINSVIRKMEHEQQKEEAASMLASMVRWCFLEVTTTGTEQKEYQPMENYAIETAYRDKKSCAKITDIAGSVFVIDFNSMMEYPEADPSDTVSVMRKDKIKDLAGGQVPDTWEEHTSNETVKLVPLKATDQEYQDVASGFSASVGNVTITNIHRVQNPHLYNQYIAKKVHLEKQNPGIQNEKTLWHGTSADALTNINHHGFNRSYCGKNATMYGNGVYFAVNARYSASPQYSPPDPSGNRYVYQSKVLVGHPTTGNQNLRVLPPRQGPILYDSATDNPNGPSMYVIFNDTQAYPEYMITFK
ncbi:protein mono-ADP-ribosyltransferase PARP14-like [Babylonia areolata]|uniref:protein mono-ADP-ribosyltransferase PARP14-like n=1 Tax=Babylonia areolata TaxID=304850 RepID=UPI003FCF4BA0